MIDRTYILFLIVTAVLSLPLGATVEGNSPPEDPTQAIRTPKKARARGKIVVPPPSPIIEDISKICRTSITFYGMQRDYPADEAFAALYNRNNLHNMEADYGSRLRLYRGFQSFELNRIARAFVDFVPRAPTPVVADIGAGLGFVTYSALDVGKYVVANDIDGAALYFLRDGDPRKRKKSASPRPKVAQERLLTVQGRFPEEIDFNPDSLGAIYYGAVTHFLDPASFAFGLTKSFRWLAPGGEIFLVHASPNVDGKLKPISEAYRKRRAEGHPAPGFFNDLSFFADDNLVALYGPSLYLLSLDEAVRAVEAAGFEVQEDLLGYFEPDGMHDDSEVHQGLENNGSYLGLVARKPMGVVK